LGGFKAVIKGNTDMKNTDMTMKELANMTPSQNRAHWLMINLRRRLPGWVVDVTDGGGVLLGYEGFRTVITLSDWSDREGRRKIRFINPKAFRSTPPRAAYDNEATLDRFASFLDNLNVVIRKETQI
jgi:hypothetical protein